MDSSGANGFHGPTGSDGERVETALVQGVDGRGGCAGAADCRQNNLFFFRCERTFVHLLLFDVGDDGARSFCDERLGCLPLGFMHGVHCGCGDARDGKQCGREYCVSLDFLLRCGLLRYLVVP